MWITIVENSLNGLIKKKANNQHFFSKKLSFLMKKKWALFKIKKKSFLEIYANKNGIGASICIGQEIQYLPYAGLVFSVFSFLASIILTAF